MYTLLETNLTEQILTVRMQSCELILEERGLNSSFWQVHTKMCQIRCFEIWKERTNTYCEILLSSRVSRRGLILSVWQVEMVTCRSTWTTTVVTQCYRCHRRRRHRAEEVFSTWMKSTTVTCCQPTLTTCTWFWATYAHPPATFAPPLCPSLPGYHPSTIRVSPTFKS